MGSCCENSCVAEGLMAQQRGTLVKVLWINALMFVAIVAAAFYGQSTALLSDSLDNFGDALTYGISLYVISRGTKAKAKAALFKGGLIFLAACFVLAQVVYKTFNPVLPSYEVMGLFSVAGLLANGWCLLLLWRHRHEDINMSSVFECSRNDIASNLSVLLAAAAVWFFDSGYPDIIVASLLAAMLFNSSWRVLKSAWQGLR
ncbi:cation transporter [Dasania marina]|uniref:cation transporter n=1 Tax=Dasania marina TaxID=471499 RepID=UPI0030DC1138|tara:strand:- start:53330 stop:53935 length:606 start_codon:yes stop_codon:yes gene_type:complete